MTTLRSRVGTAILRPDHRDVVLVGKPGRWAAAVLADPGGIVAAAVLIAAAKDRRREQEKTRCP